jgi:thymidylate synthase
LDNFKYLLSYILKNGKVKKDRTGVGTVSTFQQQLTFKLEEGYPLVTGKYTSFKLIDSELVWFLKGLTNTNFLHKYNNYIWDEWADVKGDLGPVYGSQWRSWPTPNNSYIDQIAVIIDQIKNNPNSRRIIVNSWNVGLLQNMALPPCHMFFQLYVRDNYLDLCMYQRSCDMFLGVPFNIASYALLLNIISTITGLKPGVFTWLGGDCHIYLNHTDQVEEYLERPVFKLPTLEQACDLNHIDDVEVGTYIVNNYQHGARIKAPIAI